MYTWVSAVSLFFSLQLYAIPGVVPDPVPCVLVLETHFFVESIVNQALSLYDVRQELWLLINQRLKAENLQIPARMKTRTAYMVPNPIEYPMNPLETAKILKEILFEAFADTIREYRAAGPDATRGAFNYIFSEQMPHWIRCFGPEIKKLEPR